MAGVEEFFVGNWRVRGGSSLRRCSMTMGIGRIKKVWESQATVASIGTGFDGRKLISTYEGLILVVDPRPSSFPRHKLRGIVTDIPVVPYGADGSRFYEREVCCGTDERDGMMHLYTMEEVKSPKV